MEPPVLSNLELVGSCLGALLWVSLRSLEGFLYVSWSLESGLCLGALLWVSLVACVRIGHVFLFLPILEAVRVGCASSCSAHKRLPALLVGVILSRASCALHPWFPSVHPCAGIILHLGYRFSTLDSAADCNLYLHQRFPLSHVPNCHSDAT